VPRPLRTALLVCWAGTPASLLGLAVGLIGLATGGAVRRRGRILEFHGGWTTKLLSAMPLGLGGACAMTLGHVVLGQTAADLDRCYLHEMVHVRQYERWGPLFLPLYLASSAWLYLIGRDPYMENPFEREAYLREGDADHS
jgi:hypothetical protein